MIGQRKPPTLADMKTLALIDKHGDNEDLIRRLADNVDVIAEQGEVEDELDNRRENGDVLARAYLQGYERGEKSKAQEAE